MIGDLILLAARRGSEKMRFWVITNLQIFFRIQKSCPNRMLNRGRTISNQFYVLNRFIFFLHQKCQLLSFCRHF